MRPLLQLPVLRPGDESGLDAVANEVAVAFEYNGISQAVMLATPADLEDLALGFSLSEGIVDQASDIFDLELLPSCQGITVRMEIAGAAFARLKSRRRAMAGRTGCGLCGTESLAEVLRPMAPLSFGETFPLKALYAGLAALAPLQTLQQATGACHAACLVCADGRVHQLREDVGRHNALDKTLGALARCGPQPNGALIVTSRASFEMVQKAAALGYGILAAISAPTAAAVALADKLQLCLIGFLRGNRCAIYSHPSRLQGAQP